MASLTIRRLPEDVKQDLRERAARNGRSLEDEARRALIALVRTEPDPESADIFEALHGLSRPGLEMAIPLRSPARVPDLSAE